MKLAILLFATMGILIGTTSVSTQTLGLNVIPPSTDTAGREAIVISYTGLEDSEVMLFEAMLPATTEAGCLATKDFTNLVPIPADRTYQTFGEGKKVVIVFTKTDSYGSCHAIVGRNGVNLDDFNTVRANFGTTYFNADAKEKAEIIVDAGRTRSAGPKFHLTRHYTGDGGFLY